MRLGLGDSAGGGEGGGVGGMGGGIAVVYTCVSAQDPSSRSFGCEDYISPSSPPGESLVHYATQHLSCTYDRLAAKIILPSSPHGESLAHHTT